jgi:glutaredoxin
MIEVVVYTKPGCCLCKEVKAQIAKIRARNGFDLRKVNILDDPALEEKYREEIPVVIINGRKGFKYHLKESELARRIENLSREGAQPQNGA